LFVSWLPVALRKGGPEKIHATQRWETLTGAHGPVAAESKAFAKGTRVY
jgi:hypothetical protein